MNITAPIDEELIRSLADDRVRAHAIIFAHRRQAHGKPIAPAPFHPEMIRAMHSQHPRVVCEAFRGAAKSTLAEESTVIQANLREFENALIIGASYERAVERLESIGHEIDTNEDLISAFGIQHGQTTWTESKKVMSNGVVLQAKGAGQSLRGVKYHDKRPDYVLIDDLEDEESTRTPAARQEMLRWLFKTLIPALAPHARIRFIGSRLDPEAVIVKIATDPEWMHLRYPILYPDPLTGEDRASWPAMFPLEDVYKIRDSYARQGLFEDFNQEYMCEADAPESKIFRPEHFSTIVKPRVRTWEATYAMVDPAKSSNKRSATTAIPIWSWVGSRLIVWDCRIGSWAPDGIIDQIFQIDSEYHPVFIGVEEDSLNEFIMQPLRQAQVRKSHVVPFKKMKAQTYTQGRGKTMFIESLQPFFAAHEVEFAKPMPELVAQFLSFPKGAIDGPNALAYAPRLRPGQPIYEDFTAANVVEDLTPSSGRPLYLAMNATQEMVTAVLAQYDGTTLRILADWVEEGDAGQKAAAIVRLASLEVGGRTLRPIAPKHHFEQWSNVGLRAALARVPVSLDSGGDPLAGQDEIRHLFGSSVRGLPTVQVAHAAHWTLNAFSGGYARQGQQKQDSFADKVYATLMLGLESFAALLAVDRGMDDNAANYRTSADGRRYLSAMPDRK